MKAGTINLNKQIILEVNLRNIQKTTYYYAYTYLYARFLYSRYDKIFRLHKPVVCTKYGVIPN